ncbi:MAG: hypothetical protein JNN01_26095 [Opitutaceae bacterium]|nr:hypothetical protein [Opitutaceae bacterium]
MSISAPALPFDLACKGTFTDAAGISADPAVPVAGDPLQTFARVLAGTAPAAAGAVVSPPDRCGPVAVQPGVVSEPARSVLPVLQVDSAFGAPAAEVTGNEFGPGRPGFSRHDFSHASSASPVAVLARSLAGGLPEHRRSVIEGESAAPAMTEGDLCAEVESESDEIETPSSDEVALTGEETAVSPVPMPLIEDNQPALLAVPLPVLPVPVVVEKQEFLAPEATQSSVESSTSSETPDPSGASVSSDRPQGANRAYRQSESRSSEKAFSPAEKQTRTETDLATDQPVVASASGKSREGKGRMKAEGGPAARSLEGTARGFGFRPIQGARSPGSDELPSPVNAVRGDTAAAHSADPASLPVPVIAKHGDAGANSNRGIARSEAVRATPGIDQALRTPGRSPASLNAAVPRSDATPVAVANAGLTGTAASETTAADPGDGEKAVALVRAEPVVSVASPAAPVATSPSSTGSEDDRAVALEAAVAPRSAKETPVVRPLRFATAMTRPMSDRAIAVAAPGSVPGRVRLSELSETSDPVEATAEAFPTLDSESAWRRLPMSVRDSLSFEAHPAKTGAVAPAWTPSREKFSPVQSIPAVDTASEVEPLVALETAALELSEEISAGTAASAPTPLATMSATAPVLRGAAARVTEKFAADASTAAPNRAYQRARSGLESKINTVVSGKQEFVVNKFTLGTEAAEQRPLMHPEASFVRKPSVREESISSLMGTGSLMSGELAGFSRETASSAAPMSTAQGVRDVIDAADKLWATDRPSVNFKLNLDDVGVAVRVEYREGEVTATFQTDSPELRERLAAAWQVHVASTSDQKPYRVADPVFTAPASPSSGGMPGGQDFSSGGDTARQFAQSRQSETQASFPGQMSSRNATTTAPVTEVRIPASTATSLRLHAFA